MAGNLRRPLSPRRDYSPRVDHRDTYNHLDKSHVRTRSRSPPRSIKKPSYPKENISPKDYDSYPHLSQYQQYRPGERMRSPPPIQRTVSKVSALKRNNSDDSISAMFEDRLSDAEVRQKANLYESSVASLVSLFSQLSDEVTDHAALKLQHSRLKHNLEVRTAEYEKGKQFHEKYPSTEESQRRAKEQAENEFRSVDNDLSEKAASLKHTATSIAVHVVPNSITSAEEDRIALEKLRERCNTLEATCKELERKYQEQKKICDEQLQQSSQLSSRCEELEKKHKVQQDGSIIMKTRQDKLEEQFATQIDTNRDIASSSAKISDIEAKLSEMSTEIVKERVRLATEVKTLAEKNIDLSDQVQSHLTLQTDLSKLKEDFSKTNKAVTECQELIKRSESESDKLRQDLNSKELQALKDTVIKLQHRIYGDGSTKGLDDTVFELALDEQSFREKLQNTGERITVELKKRDEMLLNELRERDARLSTLERTTVTEEKLSSRIAVVRDSFSNALKSTEEVLERKSAELGIAKQEILKEVSTSSRTRTPSWMGGTAEDTAPRSAEVSKAEFDEFKKSIAEFRAGQEKADEITGSFLTALQEDTRKLAAWTKKLERQAYSNLPNDLKQIQSQWKEDITAADSRNKALESRVSSADKRLEELDRLCGLLKEDNKKLETVVTSIPASFKKLEHARDQQDQALSTLRNDLGKLESLQKTIEDRFSRQLALDQDVPHKQMSPNSKQQALPRANGVQTPSRVASPMIPSQKESLIQTSQQPQDAGQPPPTSRKANEALANRIDVAELGIRTLAARMDNINTMDLAQNMLVQLENVYPNLRNAEVSIAMHGQALSELKTQCQVYSSNMNLLNRVINKLEEISAQVRVMRENRSLPEPEADRAGEGLEGILHDVVSATQNQGQTEDPNRVGRPSRIDQRSSSYEFPSQQLPHASAHRVASQGSLKRKTPNSVITSVGPDGQLVKKVRTQTEG